MNLSTDFQSNVLIFCLILCAVFVLVVIWCVIKLQQVNRENSLLVNHLDLLQIQQEQLNADKQELGRKVSEYRQLVEAKTQSLSEQASNWHSEKLALIQQAAQYEQQLTERHFEIKALESRWQDFEQNTQERLQFFQENEIRIAQQFESLAKKIVLASQSELTSQSTQGLLQVVGPLKEQIDQFRKQLNDGLSSEAKERHTLKHEIIQLQSLNQQLANEALNLTKALKSDNKIQGNWGEMILSKLLESVGFQEGREFNTQCSFTDEDNNRWMPDVIINLPEGRQVIVDAKVSLIAYERYYSAENEIQTQMAINELVLSLRQHMKGLSQKHYSSLSEINTLDYVLMFIPIEPAFMLAISAQENLLSEAQKQNIMLVSPSTLLVALRTIQQLWRSEYKNQNANLIAQKASKLYDKFRLFLDDLMVIGQQINKTEQSYQAAINKLTSGRGNIIKQIESFRELGVDVKKNIAETWLHENDMQDEDENSLESSDNVASLIERLPPESRDVSNS